MTTGLGPCVGVAFEKNYGMCMVFDSTISGHFVLVTKRNVRLFRERSAIDWRSTTQKNFKN